MRILVTGASGFIGQHIIQQLLNAKHDVIACVRHPRPAQQRWPNAEIIPVHYCTDHAQADWLPRVKGVDIVINCVGIIREHGKQTFQALHTQAPIALFLACEQAGVRRVIQFSALGADENAFSQYHLTKKAADDVLTGLNLDWAILMPSIVYGPGAKSMALFKTMASLPITPLVDAGDQPIHPVHINDLLKLVNHLIESEVPLKRRWEVVGPEPITMKTLYLKLRDWFGYEHSRFIAVPYPVTITLARWSGFLSNTPMTVEAVKMLRQGNTGDVNQFAHELGVMPKSVDQVLADTPPQESDHWHSGLYFIKPFLRLSIAFVWIFTGVISAFFVPTEVSYDMLAKASITGLWAPVMLYGAAATDVLLGIAVLARYQVSRLGLLQIAIILLYTIIITASQPEQWLHPFGPVTKNIPLIFTILTMMVLERRP